jgi:hypothetical protein
VSNLAPLTRWQPSDELRRQLAEMRDGMIGRMQRRGAVEPAHLSLIAGIAATLEVLDRGTRTAAAEAAAVVDGSGVGIRLIVYRNGDAIAATELAPTTAIALAGRLLDAAGSHLVDDLVALRRRARPPD